MRIWTAVALAAGLALAAGCAERTATVEGPKVDKFTGRIVHNGKPVTAQPGETVELKVFHEKGTSFGIPLKDDGSFDIGWMPIGKYTVTMSRVKSDGGKKGAPSVYSVPGGMTIEAGKTEYTIELGKDYKP